jgi:omega-6 fatty acid desaturase (delta-12 desaturase)
MAFLIRPRLIGPRQATRALAPEAPGRVQSETPSEAPRPADLLHLRPSNAAGFAALAAVSITTGLGITLALQPRLIPWTAGQLILSLAFVQWFVLLHECGHDTLLRARRLHGPIGRIAGFFSIIPYTCWMRVHSRHHRWTGWQDLDPTTAALVPRTRGRLQRRVVNVCWKCSIPIFAVAYRIENYWRLPRLFTLFPSAFDRRRLLKDTIGLAALYVLLLVLIGPLTLAVLIGPALLLSLMAEDVLLLSQHTHIPQHVSHGAAVRPFPAVDQEAFTRSLRLPAWLSMLVLHFDAHELHHMYPFLPGYRLHRVAYAPRNEVGCWRWIRMAKRMPGEVFLFQNRTESGWEI